MLVALTVPALVLDAVDGRVARRTGTVTEFGGRFDGEVDAFLILVLSVAAAPTVGWWVLAAGVVRYAFGAAGWLLPWLRGPLEFRYWRKVVTAAVGIALTVVVADVLPHAVMVGAGTGRPGPARRVVRSRRVVAVAPPAARAHGGPAAAARRRRASRSQPPCSPARSSGSRWWRRRSPTGSPPAPSCGSRWRPSSWPAPRWSSRSARRGPVTTVVGVVLGAVTLLKVLDLGAFTVLDRPFNVVTDRGELGSGLGFVNDALGPWAAVGSVVAARRPRGGRRRLPALGGPPARRGRDPAPPTEHRRGRRPRRRVGDVLRCSGSRPHPGSRWRQPTRGRSSWARWRPRPPPTGTRRPSPGRWRRTRSPTRHPATCPCSRARTSSSPSSRATGGSPCRGPDPARVRTLLDDEGARLHALGYTSASGWLGSPTFGGSSWLAHSTLPVRAHGQRPGPLRAAAHERPDDAHLRVRSGRLAHGGGAARRRAGAGPREGPSTGSTRSTAGRRSATPARSSGSPPCPTSSRSPPSSSASSGRAARRRSWRRSSSPRATARGRRCRRRSTRRPSETGRSTTASRRMP